MNGVSSRMPTRPARLSEMLFRSSGLTEPSRKNRPFLRRPSSITERNTGKRAGRVWASSRINGSLRFVSVWPWPLEVIAGNGEDATDRTGEIGDEDGGTKLDGLGAADAGAFAEGAGAGRDAEGLRGAVGCKRSGALQRQSAIAAKGLLAEPERATGAAGAVGGAGHA